MATQVVASRLFLLESGGLVERGGGEWLRAWRVASVGAAMPHSIGDEFWVGVGVWILLVTGRVCLFLAVSRFFLFF